MKSYSNVLSSLVAMLVPSLVLAQGGATETCTLTWYPPSGVQGVCGNGAGGYHTDVEDLNICVANDGGYLIARNE